MVNVEAKKQLRERSDSIRSIRIKMETPVATPPVRKTQRLDVCG
jgi:hypothetical protein